MTDYDRIWSDAWLRDHSGELPPTVVARIHELRMACKQASACLLNLMPDDSSPMARQMGKMVEEINAIWP